MALTIAVASLCPPHGTPTNSEVCGAGSHQKEATAHQPLCF